MDSTGTPTSFFNNSCMTHAYSLIQTRFNIFMKKRAFVLSCTPPFQYKQVLTNIQQTTLALTILCLRKLSLYMKYVRPEGRILDHLVIYSSIFQLVFHHPYRFGCSGQQRQEQFHGADLTNIQVHLVLLSNYEEIVSVIRK